MYNNKMKAYEPTIQLKKSNINNSTEDPLCHVFHQSHLPPFILTPQHNEFSCFKISYKQYIYLFMSVFL